mmetsp:Transcript_32754/g.101298  ORF Transcript_32754/g.101298 Transcript_32754/m.101298 type:complete len:390 (-) Transcript_32754:404-1573(-)
MAHVESQPRPAALHIQNLNACFFNEAFCFGLCKPCDFRRIRRCRGLDSMANRLHFFSQTLQRRVDVFVHSIEFRWDLHRVDETGSRASTWMRWHRLLGQVWLGSCKIRRRRRAGRHTCPHGFDGRLHGRAGKRVDRFGRCCCWGDRLGLALRRRFRLIEGTARCRCWGVVELEPQPDCDARHRAEPAAFAWRQATVVGSAGVWPFEHGHVGQHQVAIARFRPNKRNDSDANGRSESFASPCVIHEHKKVCRAEKRHFGKLGNFLRVPSQYRHRCAALRLQRRVALWDDELTVLVVDQSASLVPSGLAAVAGKIELQVRHLDLELLQCHAWVENAVGNARKWHEEVDHVSHKHLRCKHTNVHWQSQDEFTAIRCAGLSDVADRRGTSAKV